jgi:hypothetical protein
MQEHQVYLREMYPIIQIISLILEKILISDNGFLL